MTYNVFGGTSCTELKYVQFRHFLSTFRCHGNSLCSLENSDSIFEFNNPVYLTARAKKKSISCQELIFFCNFGHFLSKFGWHGNSLNSFQNSR